MKRRYPLNAKISALNQIDQLDGDLPRAAKHLNIPAKTLEKWRAKEPQLRRLYQERQWRHLDRLQFEIHVNMLDRCAAIVQQMDDNTLAKAPLNQLNAALTAMLSHVRIFQETQLESDETQETIKRAEFYYDDQIQTSPPWAGASAEQSSPLQSGRLRPPMGQDRTGNDSHPPPSLDEKQTLLVAHANPPNGEPSLARLEKFYQALEKPAHKRD